MTQKTLRKDDLRQFTGTEQWHRHGLVRKMLYTDGVHYVAETAGAYWLIDEIAFAQSMPEVAAEAFQVWKLSVGPDCKATLHCRDGSIRGGVFTKRIEFTDFPLNEITLLYTHNTLMLQSEY